MADKQNLAKKIDLNTKQDILIAGQNITIAADGKTISAANPTSVTVTPVYQAGTLVAAIVVNGNTTNIYAPAQHGDNSNQNLAASFSTSATYEEGDYVIYQENLYKCTTAITVAGAWDASKWMRVLITEEMGQGSGGDYANQNLADTYDSTSTYAVGDYVIYDGLLYKCITAITTPGLWNATYWEHVLITDEMGSGGGGDASKTELTQAEYNALVEAGEVDPNMMYFVTDGPGSGDSGSYATLLWTNGTPTSGMSANTTVTIPNLTAFDLIGIVATHNVTRGDVSEIAMQIFSTSNTTADNVLVTANSSNASNFARTFTITNDTTLTFSDGMQPGVAFNSSYTVPLKIYGLRFGNGGSGGSSEVVYSTTEHKVGTWIDGSDIYEQTVIATNLPGYQNDWTQIAQITEVDKIISYNGGGLLANGFEFQLGYYVRLTYSNGYLKYYPSEISSITITELRVTIRYTKTTT